MQLKSVHDEFIFILANHFIHPRRRRTQRRFNSPYRCHLPRDRQRRNENSRQIAVVCWFWIWFYSLNQTSHEYQHFSHFVFCIRVWAAFFSFCRPWLHECVACRRDITTSGHIAIGFSHFLSISLSLFFYLRIVYNQFIIACRCDLSLLSYVCCAVLCVCERLPLLLPE